MRDLNGAVFNTELNDLCRKYFIKGPIEPTKNEVLEFPTKYNEIKSCLFESFILNKEINFKVEGENIPLCVLVNEIGLRGIEELIDDNALSFTLWEPMIVHMVDKLDGITPIAAGRYSNGPYVDPEESVNLGLGFMRSPLRKGEVRALTRKIRDLYLFVPKGIEHDCVSITMSALESGKLKSLGLSAPVKPNDHLSREDKITLTKCASDLLSYKYLIRKHASASPTSNVQILLNNTIGKSTVMSKENIFSAILKLEDFPDIQSSFKSMGLPMDELIRVRKSKNSKKFRKWLDTLHSISDPIEAQRYYLESTQNPKGIFDSFFGKSTKSIAMMILGAYAGAQVDASIGPYVGALGSKVAGPITDYILDMADEYLFSELTKGWTPKIFINDIKQLSFKYSV
ncbi:MULTISPECIES: hypothetical protein [Klebsiella]|uniref:hypothetical protein n=1 Tax=Klebsiella TaxID=570 RepID=UPI0007CBD729|nr:hypothetical protein [Klebsiella oxytoca]MBZ7324528.1 hypothetical protein [Klebsiella oxytoca]MCW9545183.1 hypothetical protein [Klebsiella oxytoca]MCW9566700.1 hypothetical protein [Klebsiella oxytoca]MCW9577257.1 hypothetical protein [Klebsiella oxytoca]MEB6477774.1 hypothetical protein [Klebsiella oxytoca]